MTFLDSVSGTGQVVVGECAGSGPCVALATSPELTLVRAPRVYWFRPSGEPLVSAAVPFLSLLAFPRDLDLTATYRVERRGSIVATGTSQVSRDPDRDPDRDQLPLGDVLASLENGQTYRLLVTLLGRGRGVRAARERGGAPGARSPSTTRSSSTRASTAPSCIR